MKRNAINTLYNIIRIQMFTVCTTPPPAKKHGVVQRLKPAKSNIYARPRAGLLFCLASAEGAGLFFLPGGVSATHKRVYSGLFVVRAFIPPQSQNRLQGFTAAFPLICPIPSHTIQQSHKPPMHHLCHAGWHTIKRSTPTDTRHHRRTGTLYRSAQPSIIIRYIRVQGCAPVVDPCQTVQHIADHASPAAEQSSSRDTAGGTTGGYRRFSFRAFAR